MSDTFKEVEKLFEKFTKEELAVKFQTTTQTITNWQRNKHLPRLKEKKEIHALYLKTFGEKL